MRKAAGQGCLTRDEPAHCDLLTHSVQRQVEQRTDIFMYGIDGTSARGMGISSVTESQVFRFETPVPAVSGEDAHATFSETCT